VIQPTILFTTVIGFIGGLQVFAQVLILTNGGPARETETALLYIYREAFDYQDVGGATILAFVLFCFILMVTLFWMKVLDRGTAV
jgi:multiple sugar transport system permease protein